MTDHIMVLSCYVVLLLGVTACTSLARRHTLLVIVPFLFLARVAFALLVYQNNLAALSHFRLYSLYDSAGFYNEALDLLQSNTVWFPELPWYVADRGYPTLLYWLGSCYTWALGNSPPDYLYFLYFNVFVSTLTFVALFGLLDRRRVFDSPAPFRAFVLLATLEPLSLAFGSVLEREVLVGLLALVTLVAFVERRWKTLLVGSYFLVAQRSAYMYVLPIVVVAWTCWHNTRLFKRAPFLCVGLFFLGFGGVVQFLPVLSESSTQALFRHTLRPGTTGFGASVQGLPIGLRVVAYSIFGFVSPVPFYSFMDSRTKGLYLFGLLAGFSSVTYLVCHLVVVRSLVYLRAACASSVLDDRSRARARRHFMIVLKGYCAALVLHVLFQGFAYNFRHKAQIMPFLIYLSLHSLQYVQCERGVVRTGFKELTWSAVCIVVLNVVYLIGKLTVLH
ncbi:MAG: hypothetical protein U0166_21585 [Acidobacteriota bacterium]